MTRSALRWFAGGLGLAVAVGLGVVLGWQLKPEPKLEPKMILPDSSLERSRPKPPSSLGEKLTRTTVKPAQVATSEGRPGAAAVLNYCRPALVMPPLPEFAKNRGSAPPLPVPAVAPDENIRPDSLTVPEPIKAILPPFGGRLDGKRIELHSVLSDGRLYRATYRGVHTPAEFGSDADSTWLTQPRLWVRVGRGAKQCVKQTPAGALVGLALGFLVKEPALSAGIGAAASCAEGFIEEVP